LSFNIKFAANLSILCQDIPKLTERFLHLVSRKDFNFTHFECQNPYSEDLGTWVHLTKQHNVSWVLINTPPLFEFFKERIPTRQEYKQVCLEKAITYADGLSCKTIHLLMGDVDSSANSESILELIDYASRECQPHGITCVLEPLSIRPKYWLRSYDAAVGIVKEMKRENLKIMLDTFHLQRLHGNISEYIDTVIPSDLIGHVQVSQTPLRDSPMNPGEVNHDYVLNKISKVYQGVIGLEYNSVSSDSFSWINKFEGL